MTLLLVQPTDKWPVVRQRINDIINEVNNTPAGWDMLKSTYDTNDNGIVDNSEALNWQAGSHYLARTNHTWTQLANTISNFQATVSSNTNVSANTTARHTHDNKAILDATTASYTIAEASKLSGIESGAEVNTVDSVNGRTGVVTGLAEASDIPTDFVDLTTAQTKGWVLTFTDSPIVPTPTTDMQAATKKYVDDNAGWGGGGGFNPLYPHDITQGFEIFREEVTNSITYTVPTGKVLYITIRDGLSFRTTFLWWQIVSPYFRWSSWNGYNNIAIPIIVDEWVVVSSNSTNHLLTWFLCDKNINIEPIYGTSYTVPTGKILVVMSIFKDNSWTVWVGFDTIIVTETRLDWLAPDVSMDTIHQPIFVEAWWNFFSQGFSWYLIPDTFNI